MVVIVISGCLFDTFFFQFVGTDFIQINKIGSGSFCCFTCPFPKRIGIAFYLSVFLFVAWSVAQYDRNCSFFLGIHDEFAKIPAKSIYYLIVAGLFH